ncbi:MAG TPA: sigma-70 family RNA polymerase sigma factor [Actinomycetota bacterium]|nr:sigma-70 family RNA polymerase sigma factor [Actinomycetota bacterium]
MTEADWLAERFEEHRTHLRQVAYRMLGSFSEADDAVQEAWLRLSRSGADGVDNLGGWLTTVVSRVCLDQLRARKTRREEPFGMQLPQEPTADEDPEDEVVLADSLGVALLVVLETLSPAERVAFVLHDLFDLPFDEIAGIVGRSPAAARQLASRARRQVQTGSAAEDTDLRPNRAVVEAFLAAARGGSLDALMAMLDPDAVVFADDASVRMGSAAEVRGAEAVAVRFAGGAKVCRMALIDGAPGWVWMAGKTPRVVFQFTVEAGLVRQIDLVADPESIGAMDLALLAR